MKIYQIKFAIVISYLLLSSICIGQNWEELGLGITAGGNSGVHMTTFDSKLFVCGGIYGVDDMDISGVAIWDEKKWIKINNGELEFWSVRALVEFKNELYAFAHYFNNQFGELIKYDKIENSWDVVPNSKAKRIGVGSNINSGSVYKAAVFQDELYVVGEFDSIGDVSTKSIAKWNGADWLPVLDDYGNFLQMEFIEDIETHNNELYICGRIDSLNGEEYNDIARWNGQSWDNVGGGLIDITSGIPVHIRDLEVYNGCLYAGTIQSRLSDNSQIYYLLKWNDSTWEGIEGFELNNKSEIFSVSSLGKFGNFLAIGANSPRSQTFLYNGFDVIEIEQEFNLRINDFEVYNQQLYVSGYFYGVDSPNHIARLGKTFDELNLLRSCELFPNPITDYFYLNYELLNNNRITIQIFDMLGKELYKESYVDLIGEHLRAFNTEKWAAGNYIVIVKSEEFTDLKVITKIRK